MNENENNFEALRQLLALKRHEVPPPGYFENFSSQVIAGIRTDRSRRSKSQMVDLEWVLRLVSFFDAKPMFAGGFAATLCVLLVFGVVYAERLEVAAQPLMPTASINTPLAVATTADLNQQALPQPAQQSVWGGASTNPVFSASSGGGLFDSQQPATAQLASFKFQ